MIFIAFIKYGMKLSNEIILLALALELRNFLNNFAFAFLLLTSCEEIKNGNKVKSADFIFQRSPLTTPFPFQQSQFCTTCNSKRKINLGFQNEHTAAYHRYRS